MCFASPAENSPISRKESMWCSGRIRRCTAAFGSMSLIATKPFVSATWSPSRTRLQKRQSSRCDGKDAFLGDSVRADPHELADGRVDEEGRIVVAVAAAGPIDEHEILAAELRMPAPELQLV